MFAATTPRSAEVRLGVAALVGVAGAVTVWVAVARGEFAEHAETPLPSIKLTTTARARRLMGMMFAWCQDDRAPGHAADR
jgi:hypothetical protein